MPDRCLSLSRRDTERYCTEHQLSFVEDPMNRDLRFTRARLRHRWLPALRQENPQLDQALCRLAREAAAHREVLDWAARRVLEDFGEEDALRVGPRWCAIPDDVAVRALALRAGEAGIESLENEHLRALLELVRRESRGTRSSL